MGRGRHIAFVVSIAVALLATSVIVVPRVSTALGWSLFLVLAVMLVLLSPTRTITGSTRRGVDTLLSIGMLLLIAPDANALLGFPSELTSTFTIAPLGFMLLAVTAILVTQSPITRHSALWALRQRDGNRFVRWLLILALTLFFTAGIAQPIARALAALHAAPLLAAAVAIALLVPLRLGIRFDHHRLAQGDTILLGVSGLLVMRYAIEALLPGLRAFSGLDWSASVAVIVAAALAIIGLVVIALTPVSIWGSLLRLRTTADPRHLPDWPPWIVAGATGVVLVAILFPLVGISASPDGGGWLLEGPTSLAVIPDAVALRALLIGSIGATIVAIIASLHDHARRVLIAVPLVAGLAGLGVFAYQVFVSAFLWSAGTIVYAITSGSYAVILSASALFWANAILAITGFVAFLYEIGRD